MAHPIGSQPPSRKEKKARKKAAARARGGGDYGGKGSAEYQKAMGEKDYYWDPDINKYTTGSGEAERPKTYVSRGGSSVEPLEVQPSGSSDRANVIDAEVGDVAINEAKPVSGMPEKLQDIFMPKVAQDAPLVDKVGAYAPLIGIGALVLLLGGAALGRS